MKCPYCNDREIAMTLRHEDSDYSLCHPCAIQGGFKRIVDACMEKDRLEQMWNLPEAVQNR